MTDEETDDETDEDNGDDTWTWLLALLGLGVTLAPSLAPSVAGALTYRGGDKLPPLPTPTPATPPVVAVHLPAPVRPDRGLTPHGGYGAPRYVARLMGMSRSSARPLYPGQPPEHPHGGIDWVASDGQAVFAVEDGELSIADPGPLGAPGAVALVADAPGGRRWAYIHVRPDGALPRHVHTGDIVAHVGASHLHLQLTVGGVLTDPTGFF